MTNSVDAIALDLSVAGCVNVVGAPLSSTSDWICAPVILSGTIEAPITPFDTVTIILVPTDPSYSVIRLVIGHLCSLPSGRTITNDLSVSS